MRHFEESEPSPGRGVWRVPPGLFGAALALVAAACAGHDPWKAWAGWVGRCTEGNAMLRGHGEGCATGDGRACQVVALVLLEQRSPSRDDVRCGRRLLSRACLVGAPGACEDEQRYWPTRKGRKRFFTTHTWEKTRDEVGAILRKSHESRPDEGTPEQNIRQLTGVCIVDARNWEQGGEKGQPPSCQRLKSAWAQIEEGIEQASREGRWSSAVPLLRKRCHDLSNEVACGKLLKLLADGAPGLPPDSVAAEDLTSRLCSFGSPLCQRTDRCPHLGFMGGCSDEKE